MTILNVIFQVLFAGLLLAGEGTDKSPAMRQLLKAPGTPAGGNVLIPPAPLPLPVRSAMNPASSNKDEGTVILIDENKVSTTPLRGHALPPRVREREISWKGNTEYKINLAQKLPIQIPIALAFIKLDFDYGGTFKAAGSYLGNIEVLALKDFTVPGKKITLSAELPYNSIRNCGTADNPTSCIDVIFTLSVTPLIWADQSYAFRYTLKGDGTVTGPSGETLKPVTTRAY